MFELPVKNKPSMFWCEARALPVSTSPCTRLITPADKPAFNQSDKVNSATWGVSSDGLNTTVLPAKIAGTIWPLGKCPGKLYGPNIATTPCGLWRIKALAPGIGFSVVPVRSLYALIEMATLPVIAPTSVRVSQRGLPVSRAIMAANSSLCSFNCATKFSSMVIRDSIGVSAHCTCAALAALIAESTCSAFAPLPCHTTSPLLGLTELKAGPWPVCHWLFIRCVFIFVLQAEKTRCISLG